MAWNDHPQFAQGFLYVLRPVVVFKARVNMSVISYPVAEITYDTVTSGVYTGIEIGQTVLIGSTEGGYDLGRTYIRKTPTSNTLYVGWSSNGTRAGEVALSDNVYITVIDLYELWRKPSRVSTTSQVYKDYDLDGTTLQSPAMHIGDLGGPGRLDFDTTGSGVSIDFVSSTSLPIASGSSIASRSWDVKDGSITTGTASSADITASFTAGKRWISLSGTSSNGRVGTRKYFVGLINGSEADLIDTVSNVRIRRTASGQTLDCDFYETLDFSSIIPGTLVIYLQKEYRGSSVEYVQRFIGWLDTIDNDVSADKMGVMRRSRITALDVGMRLDQIKASTSEVANEASQTTWSTLVGANIDRYIHRYLEFECNAVMLSDFHTSGSSSYPFMTFNTSGGSILGVCDNLAKAIGYRFTCNSYGKLRVLIDPMRIDVADRTATVQRHISSDDWTSIRWQRKSKGTIGSLRASASVISSGYASSLLTPFPDVFAVAPGDVEGQGRSESQETQWLVQSTTELYKRVGHDYGRMNSETGLFDISVAHGLDADIEPSDMTWVNVTADGNNASYGGPTLTSDSGLPIQVTLTVNFMTGQASQTLQWEKETSGKPGKIDSRVETTPPTRSVTTPTIPIASGTLGDIGLGSTSSVIAAFDSSGKIWITNEFDLILSSLNPAFSSYSLSLTGTLCRFVYEAGSHSNGFLATTSQVRKITDIFGSRTLGAATSYTATNPGQVQLQSERGNPLNVVVMRYYDTGGVQAHYTIDGGAVWNASSGLTSNYDTNYVNTTPNWAPGCFIDPRGNGIVLTSCHTSTGSPPGSAFYRSTDGGATFSLYNPSGWTIDGYNARCIVRPIGNPDSAVFYGNMAVSGYPNSNRLYRTIGTTRTDISPTSGGRTFGVIPVDAQRAVSVADDDDNALVLIGQDNTSNGPTGKWGIFQTFDSQATTPTWNTIVAPTDNVGGSPLWLGAYYVNSYTIYFFGSSGRVGIAKYNGSTWTLYSTQISGAASIVGLVGA